MYSPQTVAELKFLSRDIRALCDRAEVLLKQREKRNLAVTTRQQIRQRKIIVETVSKKFGVPARLIYLLDRHESIARARQVCMAIACSDLHLYREQDGQTIQARPNHSSQSANRGSEFGRNGCTFRLHFCRRPRRDKSAACNTEESAIAAGRDEIFLRGIVPPLTLQTKPD